MMTSFKQLIRENYRFLLRKLDCSHEFLAELQVNEAIQHKIANINEHEQPVDRINALLTALLDVSDHLQGDLMKDVIKALKSTGQDHIADILCGSGIPASDDHYRQLQSKTAELCKYMDPENGLLDHLFSNEVVGCSEVERIRFATGPNEMTRKLVEMFMKKSDRAFRTLIMALNEVGQTHVTYILTENGNMPLSQKLRDRLISKRHILVTSIYSKGLVSVLMTKSVFTEYDQQRVECRRTENEKNEKILDLLVRKSQSDFYNFIAALDETKQSHVVVELMGAEIAASVSMILADSGNFDEEHLETELREVMKEAFKNNETGIERLNNELQTACETLVKGVEEGSIIVKLLCKNVDKLREQYYSGKLDTLFTATFCRPLASKALKSISLKIADRQFQQCSEALTAQKLMTSEHRDVLASSAKYLVDKMTISDDLLNKLSLGERRRQAIEAAATHEERVNTLLDVVSRQPDSAFTQLLDALTDTGQGQCASIIRDRTAWKTAKDWRQCNSKFHAVDEAGEETGAVTHMTDVCQNNGKSLTISVVSEDDRTTATQPILAPTFTRPPTKGNQTSDMENGCSTFDVILPGTVRVYGVTSLHSNLYVLRADCVDIYTTTNCYEHLSRRHVDGLKSAEWNDMTSSELHNSLYIADNANNIIRAVPLEEAQRDWVVPDCPCGVSVTRDDTLLVTCADIRQLLELSLYDGVCVRRTQLSAGIERPWHAVKLISGHYVVSHGTGRGLPGQHRTCVVDSDGSILYHYGALPGSGMGQLNWPCHLSQHIDELVFVADSSNNRIVLLTRDMQFMRHYVGSLSHPRRLHLERETRRLYISELRGRVVVIPLDDCAPFYCPSIRLVSHQSRRFSA